MTLRRALENSKNLVTARLLDGGIADEPAESLTRLCQLAQEAHIYKDCIRYYPFVLGAQPVRVIDLATFYAAVANEGMRPEPHAVESVEHDGKVIYRRPNKPLVAVGSADKVAFFQLKSILQGVLVARHRAAHRHLAQFVAGKTGTSDEENDAWFVGFTNDVTVAVWVGYDNRGKRRTLGGTGPAQTLRSRSSSRSSRRAGSMWRRRPARRAFTGCETPDRVRADRHQQRRAHGSPPAQYLRGRSVRRRRACRPRERAFMEHFRVDQYGRIKETQSKLVSRGDAYGAPRDPDGWGGSLFDFGRFFQGFGSPQRYGSPGYGNPGYGNQRYSNPSYGTSQLRQPELWQPTHPRLQQPGLCHPDSGRPTPARSPTRLLRQPVVMRTWL